MSEAMKKKRRKTEDDVGVIGISDGGIALPLASSLDKDEEPSVHLMGVFGLSDGGLSHPSSPSGGPSVSLEGVLELSDGGLAHPSSPSGVPSVSLEGVLELSDGGLAHSLPLRGPSVSLETVLDIVLGNVLDSVLDTVFDEPLFELECSSENESQHLCRMKSEGIHNVMNEIVQETVHEIQTDIVIETLACGNSKREKGLTRSNEDSFYFSTKSSHAQAFFVQRNANELGVIIPSNAESVIFGSFNQGDYMFSSFSRGSQCVANSVCCLIKAGNMFTSLDLDEVLKEGDCLYKKNNDRTYL